MRFQQFMQKAKKSKKVQRGKKQDVNRDGRNAGGNKQSNKENQ